LLGYAPAASLAEAANVSELLYLARRQ